MMKISGTIQVNATLVSNEFIDHCMAQANGEYVKVYLYVLRHGMNELTIEMIADGLNHTESDVRRALNYWRNAGLLLMEEREEDSRRAEEEPAAALLSRRPPSMRPAGLTQEQKDPVTAGAGLVEEMAVEAQRPSATISQEDLSAIPEPIKKEGGCGTPREPYPIEKLNRLTKDEDFTQLLYIAQKYMNKVFTQRECEVFAYLYDGLSMSFELLEYLVEYCVSNGHTSMRYIETVGLNWNEKGLRTVEEAKAYSAAFTKDSFAVMKAFGLTDRKPGTLEKEMIEKWVKSYGFAKEVIVEACNRTMAAIHNPSFQYADKILSGWNKSGVKSLSDIRVLDQKRQAAEGKPPVKKNGSANGFHNFSQRNTDYDAMIIEGLREQ